MSEHDRPGSLLRWGLIAALTYVVLFDGDSPDPDELVFVAVLLASAVGLPRLAPLASPISPAALALSVDTVLVLVGLSIGDAASSDLLVAYFVAILLASLGDSEKRVAGIAFLVTAGYALWAIPDTDTDTPLLLRLPFLLLTTLFYGTMMQRLRAERGRRLASEGQVRELDFLLRVTNLLGSSTATREVLERSATIVRESLGVARCEVVSARSGEIDDALASEAIQTGEITRRRGPTGQRLAIPILHERGSLGVILVETGPWAADLDEAAVRLLRIVANAAAPALQNVHDFEEIVLWERARSDVLLDLSRRLRVLATSILAHSELARQDLEARKPLAQHLEEIIRCAEAIYEGTEEVPARAGLTFGFDSGREGRIDLGELLEETIRAAWQLCGTPPRKVTVRLDPDLPAVRSNRDELRHVLENLLWRTFRTTGWGSVAIEGKLALPSGTAAPRGSAHGAFVRLRVRGGSASETPAAAEGTDLSALVSGWLAELLGVAVRVEPGPESRRCYEVWIPVT